jgi:hypothetical protein
MVFTIAMARTIAMGRTIAKALTSDFRVGMRN